MGKFEKADNGNIHSNTLQERKQKHNIQDTQILCLVEQSPKSENALVLSIPYASQNQFSMEDLWMLKSVDLWFKILLYLVLVHRIKFTSA